MAASLLEELQRRPAAAGDRAALQKRLEEARATAKWQKTCDHYKVLGVSRTCRSVKQL